MKKFSIKISSTLNALIYRYSTLSIKLYTYKKSIHLQAVLSK